MSAASAQKSVNVSFKTFTRGEIAHLVIDYTGLKVFGEGEVEKSESMAGTPSYLAEVASGS